MKKEIVFLQGGLGNQLFQYAFYFAKKKKGINVSYDSSAYFISKQHNGYELERLFNIKASGNKITAYLIAILCWLNTNQQNVFARLIFTILRSIRVRLIEDNFPSLFYRPFLSPQEKKGLYLFLGYWQTEKYFEEIRCDLFKVFAFNHESISKDTKLLLQSVKRTNSASVHIRRGDYLSSQNNQLYGEICTIEYYDKAIRFLSERINNITFYVFSNDIDWVKEHIQIPNSTFIDFNQGNNSWEDLFLMSHCKHNIIANSSFSWWGAWLNQNPQKIVVSPSRFLNTEIVGDIIPQEWIKL